MVEAAPAASLVVGEAEFLLQFLIVTLDPPAQLGQIDEIAETGICRQCGEPIFGGLRLTSWPFDQTPFLRSGAGAVVVSMRRADTHGGKARDQRCVGAVAPGDPRGGAGSKDGNGISAAATTGVSSRA